MMITTRYFILTILLVILSFVTSASAQTARPGSNQRVDFVMVYSSLDLAFDTWDNETSPDTVKLAAYRVASGFLAGVPFRYERSRDRMTVYEQVDDVAQDLEYHGFREDSGIYYFDYTVWVPYTTYETARAGSSYQGHGVSELEDIAAARNEARYNAFEEVARSAIRKKYTESGAPLPGIIDGRITWYEIQLDQTDQESGQYVFNIDAWVSIDEG